MIVKCSSNDDKQKLLELISSSDILLYNYNDNILSDFNIDIEGISKKFPHLILAEYSEYGSHTTYKDKRGDELLIQAISGITLLTGNRDDAPTPMGFDVATQFCTSYLVQAILAALFCREEDKNRRGTKVSSSLLEAVVQIQLEFITTAANSGMQMPKRTIRGNAHAGLPAPYGVYRSKDGFFAMSMISIPYLADIMGLTIPKKWIPSPAWLWYRDEIMSFLEPHFLTKTNSEWMDIFTPLDVWCSDIFDIPTTLNLEAYKILELEQSYPLEGSDTFVATRLPYHITTNGAKKANKKRIKCGDKPLEGVVVVDISQYLSGPTSTLMLADLGATVIKIERPKSGDMGRNVIINNLLLDDTSTSFLAVGRNKRSVALDLKNSDDIATVKKIMRKADVIVQNFRPTVMKRLGLDYDTIKEINPSVIYAEVSGYGQKGCWVGKPGQDYIVQALSGLCTISGQRDSEPVPLGLSVVDLISGCHVDEAVLASLYNREFRGDGAHILVTMFEGAMDLQSDFITAYRWGAGENFKKSKISNVHSGENAPCGIYKTMDGYIAIGAISEQIAIDSILNDSLKLKINSDNMANWRDREDSIKFLIAKHLKRKSTKHWIEKFSKIEGMLYSEIYDWEELFDSPLGKSLKMLQKVTRGNGYSYITTRAPIRINDKILTYPLGGPQVGEYSEEIINRQ
ncbi:MAG: CoA transferase [Rikenellaceae bacterium]